jgi:hypothetical protein
LLRHCQGFQRAAAWLWWQIQLVFGCGTSGWTICCCWAGGAGIVLARGKFGKNIAVSAFN